MPNIESEQNHARNNGQESHNLFRDAYNLEDRIRSDFARRFRQANLISYAAMTGGLKDIPNEFFSHPWEAVGKLSVVGVTRVALGTSFAAESPLFLVPPLLQALSVLLPPFS